MKFIRTLKNIEKLMNAKEQYSSKETIDEITFVNYCDTRWEISVEETDNRLRIRVFDHEHTSQLYVYGMTSNGWEFDNSASVVTCNKQVNDRLRSDLTDIKNGCYKGQSHQEYDLSLIDTKQILDMIYTFTESQEVVEIVEKLYADLNDLDATIVYKHTTIESIAIISGNGRYAVSMRNGKWEAYNRGMILSNLTGIPNIIDYVLYDNFRSPYLERDRVRPLPEAEVAETIENQVTEVIDQVVYTVNQNSNKKEPVALDYRLYTEKERALNRAPP